MKTNALLIGLMSTLLTTTVYSAINVRLSGQPAKRIYRFLTGPDVVTQGAAGHLYKQGKEILCRYTNADMQDKDGKEVSRHDFRRYACVIRINKDGRITTPENF